MKTGADDKKEHAAGADAHWEKLAFPRVCGLLADRPTGLSLAMHSSAFASSSLPFCYINFDTVDTGSALSAMRALGMRGFSLTIPHKEVALTLVDELTERAALIGAVNTVVNSGSALLGANTDYDGVVNAFAEASVSFAGKRVVLWGAGGAAGAAVVAAVKSGAAAVAICNRNPERAELAAESFRRRGIAVESLPHGELQKFKADVLINATPMGSHLAAHDPSRWPLDRSEPYASVVFDMVTKETPLLDHTRRNGGTAIPGIRMLLHQAVRQFEIFTGGEPAPVAVMEKALAEAVRG